MNAENVNEHTTIEIDLKEFSENRAEINNRTGILNKLQLGQTTILGLGISLWSIIGKVGNNAIAVYPPHILLGISIFCSFLFHFWCEQAQQIYKLGAYIGKDLAGRLREQSGNKKVLGWEGFSKTFDKGGAPATTMLFGERTLGKEESVPTTRNIITIVGVLMGGVPALFAIVAFVFMGLQWENASLWLRIIEICVGLIAVALWIYAWMEYRLVCRKRELLDKAVIDLDLENDSDGRGGNAPPKTAA